MPTSSDDWMLSDQLITSFLDELRNEHMKRMLEQGLERAVIDEETLIDYSTFNKTYSKMNADFKSRCPKTMFIFTNNGMMQTRYDDLVANLHKLVYYFEDYNELCYSDGEFREVIEFEGLLNYVQQTHLARYRSRYSMSTLEFNDWANFVKDHIRFVLNPLKRHEILVTDVIESDILVHLRSSNDHPWLKFDTLKDFRKRFRDAACKSEFSDSMNHLVKRDFHQLNVLEDDEQQPYTEEFVDRLFEYLSAKKKLADNEEYKMDFRTFVNIRRMLFHPKSVATRQFLFEIIDLKGDGFIDVDEVRHFYNGLQRMHNEIDMEGDLPFALFDEFYISWFDQIENAESCMDKKRTFEQLKYHPYGDECLMMLINYKSLTSFDRRFEVGLDPRADTIAEDDETFQLDGDEVIKESELDDLLGPAVLGDKTNLIDNNNELASPPPGMRILKLERSPKSGRQSF